MVGPRLNKGTAKNQGALELGSAYTAHTGHTTTALHVQQQVGRNVDIPDSGDRKNYTTATATTSDRWIRMEVSICKILI